MADSMKEYRDTILILESQGTAESKCNKLLKIKLSTEDDVLRALVSNMAEAYRLYVKHGWHRTTYPHNHAEWLELVKEKKKDLSDYCLGILSIQKPQWQILAERNGWHM